MTFLESLQYLNSFINYELHLDRIASSALPLERFENLLKSLGSPHKDFKAVHVAGTKGKGSTCEFTAAILRKFGFRVGLYTSPHLLDIRERIRVLEGSESEGCVPEKDFCALLETLKPELEKARQSPLGPPTYFEVLTALAFCYFQQKQLDYVVLETGLGGRLDATNVVQALVCGITPISLEHTQILGNTLTAIAEEKAAIIKNANPVIVAPQKIEVLSAIRNRCQHFLAREVFLEKDITWQRQGQDKNRQRFSVRTAQGEYPLQTKLLGEHSCMNAAMAIGLVEAVQQSKSWLSLKDHPWKEMIAQAIEDVTLPGRFEIFSGRRTTILDVAHTPESIEGVGKTLRELFPSQKVLVVLGLSRDKDKQEIIQRLAQFSDDIILTQADHPRAEKWEEDPSSSLKGKVSCSRTDSVKSAINLALKKAGKEDDVILVVGSFFVVAEAKQCLA